MSLDNVDTRLPRPIEAFANLEIKRGAVEIAPIGAEEVGEIIDKQYQEVFDLEQNEYDTKRGVRRLLTDKGNDYGQLPDLPDRSSLDYITNLPAESTWLDAACGSGVLIDEVLKEINPDLKAVGFDARKWKALRQIPHFIEGNIDKLHTTNLPEEKFDLVTCASLLQHLPDYWGAILRMSRRLNPKGVMLASTLPRIGKYRERIANGKIQIFGKEDMVVDKLDGSLDYPQSPKLHYYHNKSVLNTAGEIVPMKAILEALERYNPHLNLHYSQVKRKRSLADEVGGQLAMVDHQGLGLNLGLMFYCRYPVSRSVGELAYLLAKNGNEAERLREAGFVSLQERFEKSVKGK